jgi:hypothetical protein
MPSPQVMAINHSYGVDIYAINKPWMLLNPMATLSRQTGCLLDPHVSKQSLPIGTARVLETPLRLRKSLHGEGVRPATRIKP